MMFKCLNFDEEELQNIMCLLYHYILGEVKKCVFMRRRKRSGFVRISKNRRKK